MRLTAATTLAIAMLLSTFSSANEADLYSIPLKDIDGNDTTLKPYAGKVLLIVNVASQCGYTSQYAGLEALWRQYKDKGVVVLGFPSNDFGAQEPGSEAEIKQFCTSRYNVSFPMFSKVHVKGADQHPLYRQLTSAADGKAAAVKWNFGKFVVGRDGQVVARFGSDVEPDAPELIAAIDQVLARK